jgi:hypothetical protein
MQTIFVGLHRSSVVHDFAGVKNVAIDLGGAGLRLAKIAQSD